MHGIFFLEISTPKESSQRVLKYFISFLFLSLSYFFFFFFFLPISSWKKQNTGYSPLTASVLPAGDTKKKEENKKAAPYQLMPPRRLLLLELVSSRLRLPPSFVLAFLTLPSRTRTYREKATWVAFLRSANHRRHALIRQHDHKRQSSGPSHAPVTRTSGWQVALGRAGHPLLPLLTTRANGPEILHWDAHRHPFCQSTLFCCFPVRSSFH